jgi:hypothetical protein
MMQAEEESRCQLQTVALQSGRNCEAASGLGMAAAGRPMLHIALGVPPLATCLGSFLTVHGSDIDPATVAHCQMMQQFCNQQERHLSSCLTTEMGALEQSGAHLSIVLHGHSHRHDIRLGALSRLFCHLYSTVCVL